MNETHDQFELVEFEQVDAARGTALLRVAARPAPNMAPDGLTLVINDGQAEHRHKQLPTLPAPPGLIRAAFSAPLDQIRPDSTYSLAFADGELVRLSRPTRRRTTLGSSPAAGGSNLPATSPVSGPATEGSGASSRLVDLERRVESQKLAIAELERRLHSERERLSAAESDISHARSQRDAALAERDKSVADNAAELERMRVSAEIAHARAQAAQDDASALGEKLAQAEARVTALEAEVGSLHDAAARAQAQHGYDLETAQARLEAAQAEVEVARTEAQALRHHSSQLEVRLAEFEAALTARGAEIDVLREALKGTSGSPAAGPDSTYLQTRLAEARAEVSAGLLAEIELLRAQARESAERLATAASRVQAADAALAARTSELEHARNAASLVADELRAADDLAETARTDTEMHKRRAGELNDSLASAQRTLRDARDTIATHEAQNQALEEAVRAETERRIRAEEALVAAAAQHALTTESLALEAVRHGA